MGQSIFEDAFILHEISFEFSLNNWRWYVKELGEQLMKKNGLALVIKPIKAELESGFRVQELLIMIDMDFLPVLIAQGPQSNCPPPTYSFTLNALAPH
jgi:hypothetical protein